MQINDLEQPELPRLGRQQLWLGLLAWVEHPERFHANIDSSRIVAREEGGLRRELLRGSTVSADSVRLAPEDGIEIVAGPGGEFSGSELSVRIEEPRPEALFLRFRYRLQGAGIPTDEAELRALRQAYYFADLETVRQLRLVAPVVL